MEAEDADEKLNTMLQAAQEHLDSISRRSNKLKAAFLYNEILKTSAKDEDHLGVILERLSSILAAVCDHGELMNVKPLVMPTVWRDMIESLRKQLKVSIAEVGHEYVKMLDASADKEFDLEEDDESAQDVADDPAVLTSKVRTILKAFSVNQDIFWFRWVHW